MDFLEDLLGYDFLFEQPEKKECENLASKEVEILSMQFKLKQMELELESQKRLSKHFEGMYAIMIVEFQKAKWRQMREKNAKLISFCRQFQTEVKGFLLEKQKMLERIGRIERIVNSINVILK